MASRKQNLRTARLLARMRYRPEIDMLQMLLSDARGGRDIALRNADAGAEGLSASLAALQPQFDQTYAQEREARSGGLAEAMTALQGVGPSAGVDAIRAGLARESAGAIGRSSAAQGRDVRELGQRRVDVQSAAKGERSRAQSQFRSDADKIAQRLAGIARDQGAFIETQFTQLSKQDREAATKEANLEIDRERLNLEGDRIDISQDTLEETKRANRADEATARENARKKGKGGSRTGRPSAKDRAGAKAAVRLLTDMAKASPYAKKPRKKNGKTIYYGQRLVADLKKRAQRQNKNSGKTGKASLPADPLLYEAAAELAIYGRLDRSTRKQLQASYGIGGV